MRYTRSKESIPISIVYLMFFSSYLSRYLNFLLYVVFSSNLRLSVDLVVIISLSFSFLVSSSLTLLLFSSHYLSFIIPFRSPLFICLSFIHTFYLSRFPFASSFPTVSLFTSQYLSFSLFFCLLVSHIVSLSFPLSLLLYFSLSIFHSLHLFHILPSL